jgi:DNA-binding response OmpR family regulator
MILDSGRGVKMGKKILVIDDNEQDRKIMKRFLNKAGYEEILTAATGEEGIIKAKSEQPDLVILDTLLPDQLGFDICSQIKQDAKQNTPIIIIITGTIDAVDAVKARESGADDYCVKTTDCVPLLEAVKSFI